MLAKVLVVGAFAMGLVGIACCMFGQDRLIWDRVFHAATAAGVILLAAAFIV